MLIMRVPRSGRSLVEIDAIRNRIADRLRPAFAAAIMSPDGFDVDSRKGKADELAHVLDLIGVEWELQEVQGGK